MDELDALARTARWLAALPGELGMALLSVLGALIALESLLRAARPVPLKSAFARRPEGAGDRDARDERTPQSRPHRVPG